MILEHFQSSQIEMSCVLCIFVEYKGCRHKLVNNISRFTLEKCLQNCHPWLCMVTNVTQKSLKSRYITFFYMYHQYRKHHIWLPYAYLSYLSLNNVFLSAKFCLFVFVSLSGICSQLFIALEAFFINYVCQFVLNINNAIMYKHIFLQKI